MDTKYSPARSVLEPHQNKPEVKVEDDEEFVQVISDARGISDDDSFVQITQRDLHNQTDDTLAPKNKEELCCVSADVKVEDGQGFVQFIHDTRKALDDDSFVQITHTDLNDQTDNITQPKSKESSCISARFPRGANYDTSSIDVDGTACIYFDAADIDIPLVDSDSPECPASHTLKKCTKLVVSASGNAANDCEIIWRLGYRNVLDSIESVVKKAVRGELKREVSCPDCMANSDPRDANVWQLNDHSVYDAQPTLYCEAGHSVSTQMIYGPQDNDTDATTVSTTCVCTSSITSGTFREERPKISIEKLLGTVVLVGLWDTKEERVVDVGTGFIADGSKGLILTAGHIFYELEEGKEVVRRFKGREDVKIIIGTMKSKEGNGSDTAQFTYSAKIIAHDIANTDAVVLRITNKFEKPFHCPSGDLKLRPDVPIMHGKFKREDMEKLGLRDAHLEEEVRIIGFNQSGEGRYKPGEYINHTASIAKGYVCKKRTPVSHIVPRRKGRIFSPRSEVIVELTVYEGQSGGPCVNRDGKVIGIVSRNLPNDYRRCYLVPSSELMKILRKARQI